MFLVVCNRLISDRYKGHLSASGLVSEPFQVEGLQSLGGEEFSVSD